jgi:hypothetical protein
MSSLGVRDFDFSAQGCWHDATEVASKIGSSISGGVSRIGTMFYNGGHHTIVWIRDSGAGAYNWLKQGAISIKDHTFYVGTAIKEGAATGIRWTFHTVSTTFDAVKPQIVAFATSVKQGVTNLYQGARNFVHAHPNETTVAIVALCLGILLTLAIERIFGEPRVIIHGAPPRGHEAAGAAHAAGRASRGSRRVV